MGDAPGRHAEGVTREAVRPEHGFGTGRYSLIVVVRQPGEHTGERAFNGVRGETGMFHCLPGGFEQQAVLGIKGGGLVFVNAEELGVEPGDVVEKCAPLRHRAARQARLGVVVLVDGPAVTGHFGDHVIAPEQRLPEQLWGIDAARKPAGHADDGDRSGWSGPRCGRRVRLARGAAAMLDLAQ